MISTFPWKHIEQNFIKNYATTPNIAFDGIGLCEQDLRRHVDRSAHNCTIHGVVLHLLVKYHFGEPEVRYFYYIYIKYAFTVLADQDVLSLDIAMEDATLVQILDSLGNLVDDGDCLLLFNMTFGFKDRLQIPGVKVTVTLWSSTT